MFKQGPQDESIASRTDFGWESSDPASRPLGMHDHKPAQIALGVVSLECAGTMHMISIVRFGLVV